MGSNEKEKQSGQGREGWRKFTYILEKGVLEFYDRRKQKEQRLRVIDCRIYWIKSGIHGSRKGNRSRMSLILASSLMWKHRLLEKMK